MKMHIAGDKRIILTSAGSFPGSPLPPFLRLVQRSQVAKSSRLDQDFCKTPCKQCSSSALIPPLEVVARSKAVAEASPLDSCSAIVAREAPRPKKGVVGGVGGGIGRVRGEEVTLGSPKA